MVSTGDEDGSKEASPRRFEFRESLLSGALKAGNLDVILLLHEFGADLGYRDESGYTALLHAVYGIQERLPLIRTLIDLGVDVSAASTYRETPIGTAYGFGQWCVVAELLAAGADPEPLGWTPLHHAIAVGTCEDAERAIESSTDLNAHDAHGRTPVNLALFRGRVDLVDLLLAHGADSSRRDDEEPTNLSAATAGGHPEAVAHVLAWGVSAEERDDALHVAVDTGHHAAAELLLQSGSDPDHVGDHVYTVLQSAQDHEMVRLLVRYGADPTCLDHEGRRRLLGLLDPDADVLTSVTREEYLASRYPREGAANPEEQADAFRLAMIRSGVGAWRARETFDDPATFSCGVNGRGEPPVWCFDRFGQSTTILPDGRIVLIAGEHEDYYDPDFCIYNDVAVFDPEGRIILYGYPHAVFPPTDFHSATLLGEWIYLVGSLGYVGDREGAIPVRRLSTTDFHIETVTTTGVVPGRLYDHRATLVADQTLRISGGKLISFTDSEESHDPNAETYLLDLQTLIWTKG